MVVGAARYDLRVPGVTSLKEKRSVVRKISSMVQGTFSCSVAEVGHQDLRQRAAIGVAIVTETHFHARKILSEITRHIETYPAVELISASEDVLVPEDWA